MGWNRADSIVLSGMHSRVVIAHTPYTFTVRRKMPKLPRGQVRVFVCCSLPRVLISFVSIDSIDLPTTTSILPEW